MPITRKVRRVVCAIILGISLLGTGCSEIKMKKVSEMGSISDKKVIEDEKEVKDIKLMIEGFFKATTTRDYRTIKGDEEYSFYTQEKIDELIATSDKTTTVEMYKKFHLIKEHKGLGAIEKLEINKEKTEAVVIVEEKYSISNASPDIMMDLKMDEIYPVKIGFILKNINGSWKVDKVYNEDKLDEIRK